MCNHSSHFDDNQPYQFKTIKDLKWWPWIGANYGKAPCRLLVLGESHYVWDATDAIEKLNHPGFTQLIVKEQGLPHLSEWQQREGEGNWRLFRNVERVLFNKKVVPPIEREKLWNHVAFCNLVQRYVASRKDRPAPEDYDQGWKVILQVMRILKPHYVLVLGHEWKKIQALNGYFYRKWDMKLPIEFGKPGGFAYCKNMILPGGASEQDLIFIRHPSAFFSWRRWAPVVQKNLVDFIRFLESK